MAGQVITRASTDPTLEGQDENTNGSVYHLSTALGVLEVPYKTIITYKGLDIVGHETASWNLPIQKNFVILADQLSEMANRIVVLEETLAMFTDGGAPVISAPGIPIQLTGYMDYTQDVTVTGTSESNTEVLLYESGVFVSSTLTNTDGTWAAKFTASSMRADVTYKARRAGKLSDASPVYTILHPQLQLSTPMMPEFKVPDSRPRTLSLTLTRTYAHNSIAESALGVLFRNEMGEPIGSYVAASDLWWLGNPHTITMPLGTARIEFSYQP